MNNRKIASAFPFESYRTHQREILTEATHALFDNPTTDTVVIDAPTGIGKSGINMALCALSGSAFYTTPQKQLRNQLDEDTSFDGYHQPLRGRADYICEPQSDEEREYTCESCPINKSDDESCRDHGCQYWLDKESAMGHNTATVTFSYLIVDNHIPLHAAPDVEITVDTSGQQNLKDYHPETDEDGPQISFDDRELLVIDEAHALEEQVASLHAGFTLSTETLSTPPLATYDNVPEELATAERGSIRNVYDVFCNGVDYLLQEHNVSVGELTAEMFLPVFESLTTAIKKKKRNLARASKFVVQEDKERIDNITDSLDSVIDSVELMTSDYRDDEAWVVSVDSFEADDETRYRAEFKPVLVDSFLQEFVWSRADKVVLSTATMPYRDEPGVWLERLGLDPTTARVISKPMPFDAANRPVDATTTVGNLSGDGKSEHWDELTTQLETLLEKHAPENGLVHTVSYNFAERIHDAFPERSLCDVDEKSSDRMIEEWQESDAEMLLSPTMMEGVDLEGEVCRWQVLAKTPYKPLGDPRVDYLLNEEGNWRWYKETAARRIIQSAGRAVRSSDDYATYYILDSAYQNVLTSARTPEWFEIAMVT
jgi:Rad3-related DNA helicase